MRFGSVCSGIEAASVAWNPIGFEAAWLAEIEPFPCALLAHHYPDVPNLGDMTTIAARIASGEVEAPDLFCGGTPCQAFSVAGLRNSLDDARGNLSLTFCEIADAVDAARSVRGLQPAIVFWENVPGVLNTKDNAFGCFLAGLAGEDEPLVAPGGKWSNAGVVLGPQRAVAWRVLDAQYFGVAQRRRRVFVVASAREGFDPAEVLFEFDGVRRDSAPSRKTGQEVAGTIAGCANGGGANGPGRDVDSVEALQVVGGVDCFNGRMTGDAACTLTSGGVTDAFSPAVMVPAQDPAHPLGACHGAYRSYGEGQFNYITHSLRGEGAMGVAIATLLGGIDYENNGHAADEPTGPLLKGSPTGGGRPLPAVAFTQNTRDEVREMPYVGALAAQPGMKQTSYIRNQMQVRRLTPVECERLQGFHDDYTLVPHRGKPAADGPRYKALGNSWAVPVVRWIGERIKAAL